VNTHFVVSRANWRAANGALVRLGGETRVTAFDTFDAADRDRAARELRARAHVNPFRCGTLWAERSHMPESVFCDFLEDVDIVLPLFDPVGDTDDLGQPLNSFTRAILEQKPLPEGVYRSWAHWWDKCRDSLSPNQIARVWEAMDRLRFFSVSEQPKRTVAYLVLEIRWNYNDEWYYPQAEGGAPHTAYRTRARAEEECARLNAEAREEWRGALNLPALGAPVPAGIGAYNLYPFDMEDRRFPDEEPFGPHREPPHRAIPGEDDPDDYEGGCFGVDEVPFYEVQEIELPEGQ
jgi:hypothetical protein